MRKGSGSGNPGPAKGNRPATVGRLRWTIAALVLAAACGSSYAALSGDRGPAGAAALDKAASDKAVSDKAAADKAAADKAAADKAAADKAAADKAAADKAAADKAAADKAVADKAAAERSSVDIEGARTALQDWVKQRQLIAKERRDWAINKQMIIERVDLLKGQVDSLREKIDKIQEDIAKEDKNQAGVVAEKERLKKLADSLRVTVASLEARTKGLLKRLPDSITKDIGRLSQMLPDNASAVPPNLTLGLRFQNVVGILDYLNKRNDEITTALEVNDWPGGGKAEATVLYLGISQAYYVSGDGKIAGFGAPSGDRWAWTAANEAGPEILRAISIYKNEQTAVFVKLPIKVH